MSKGEQARDLMLIRFDQLYTLTQQLHSEIVNQLDHISESPKCVKSVPIWSKYKATRTTIM